MQVHRLMTPNPLTVAPQDTLADALGIMLRNDIHELPVTENERLVGILTLRDIQVMLGPDGRNLKADALDSEGLDGDVADAMSTEVQTIDMHESAANAARLLVNLRVGAVPVVDAHGRLRGILSVTDLLAAAAPLFERA